MSFLPPHSEAVLPGKTITRYDHRAERVTKMMKLEPSTSQFEAGNAAEHSRKLDLFPKVEKAVLQFMDQNNGKLPSVEIVRSMIGGGSNRDLCSVVKEVKQKQMALQTKLGTMPDIPEELVLAHSQALKEMWAKTREFQTAEITDLKRAQQARDAMHAEEVHELYAIIATLEVDGEALLARAEAAEGQLEATRKKLDAMKDALAAAQARLAEREDIMAMLAASKAAPREQAAKKAGKAGRLVPEQDEQLPGFNEPEAERNDPAAAR